jgi:DNA-binding LacI/PurR family transcriptional regulator
MGSAFACSQAWDINKKDFGAMSEDSTRPGAVTLHDVAVAAGVTIATASRSLTGAYGVHPETRKRVLEAAEKLQYKPNRFARALVTGRSNVIGLVVSDVRNPYFAEIARGAEDASYAAGRDLVLCNSDLDAVKQMRYINSLLERRVEGIVMNSVMNLSRKEQSYIAESGVPIVLLYRPKEATCFSSVSTDSERGGELAANCLLENGHRHMVYLSGPRQHANLSKRVTAFLDRVRKAGSGATATAIYGTHTLAGGYEMAKNLFRKPGNITGIATANDAVAFGVLKAALEMKVQIPRDFSLIGFDDVELASIVHPPLTTIRQSKYEIGSAAVEILLRLTAGKDRAAEHRVLGVELIERASVRNLGRTAN